MLRECGCVSMKLQRYLRSAIAFMNRSGPANLGHKCLRNLAKSIGSKTTYNMTLIQNAMM